MVVSIIWNNISNNISMRIRSDFAIKRSIKLERHFFKFQLITLTFMTG